MKEIIRCSFLFCCLYSIQVQALFWVPVHVYDRTGQEIDQSYAIVARPTVGECRRYINSEVRFAPYQDFLLDRGSRPGFEGPVFFILRPRTFHHPPGGEPEQ